MRSLWPIFAALSFHSFRFSFAPFASFAVKIFFEDQNKKPRLPKQPRSDWNFG